MSGEISVLNESLEVESESSLQVNHVESESFRATTEVKLVCTTDSSQVESVYIQTRVESRVLNSHESTRPGGFQTGSVDVEIFFSSPNFSRKTVALRMRRPFCFWSSPSPSRNGRISSH